MDVNAFGASLITQKRYKVDHMCQQEANRNPRGFRTGQPPTSYVRTSSPKRRSKVLFTNFNWAVGDRRNLSLERIQERTHWLAVEWRHEETRSSVRIFKLTTKDRAGWYVESPRALITIMMMVLSNGTSYIIVNTAIEPDITFGIHCYGHA